jgi:AbrB family looped-hinge helix DNA binding protein
MTVQVTVTASGRMSLPADIRKKLGLAKGGAVFVDETPEGVMLRTTDQILARARALSMQYDSVKGASVDDFLAGRAVESGQ